MADLGNSKRAQLLVDGDSVSLATTQASSSANVIASVVEDEEDGWLYVEGNIAGSATINVLQGTRSGSLDVTVVNDPLVVTLGTPEPK